MNADHQSLSHHPAPHRHKVHKLESAFALWGGPAAWFLQLCAGYALSSWPCFPHDLRLSSPPPSYQWTAATSDWISIVALTIAIVSLIVSARILNRTREEVSGDHGELLERGTGRTRFLGMWGLLLGAGFAVATIFDAPGLLILPRCAG